MTLVLFTEEDLYHGRTTFEIPLDPVLNKTGSVWHIMLPTLDFNFLYGEQPLCAAYALHARCHVLCAASTVLTALVLRQWRHCQALHRHPLCPCYQHNLAPAAPLTSSAIFLHLLSHMSPQATACTACIRRRRPRHLA